MGVDFTKTVPHSIEAEQAVLGALMQNNSAFEKIAGWLIEEDFYRRDHRLIWRNIVALIASHGADAVTVFERLQAQSIDDEVGGLSYLSSLVENTPGSSGIVGYANIVRDRALKRKMLIVMDEGIALACGSGSPAAEVAADIEQRVYRLNEGMLKVTSDLPSVGDLLPQVKQDIQIRMESGGPVMGICTGMADLDKVILGMHPAQLIVIGGRPSMGKTAFAMQAATHAAMNLGNSVCVFSMEMSGKQLVSRMAASAAEIDLMDIRRGTLDSFALSRWSAMENKLSQSPIYIDDRAALTVPQMRASLRRVKRKYGLDLVVVDHIGLANGEGRERNQQISSITKGLKAIAKEFEVPVLALNQINRVVDKQAFRKPVLADLKESGALEEDADVVIFLYREEFYNPDTPNRGVAELIVAKQRDGPPANIFMSFIGKYARFADLAYGWRPVSVGTASAPQGFD